MIEITNHQPVWRLEITTVFPYPARYGQPAKRHSLMSIHAGGRHRPHPDSPSSTRCSWSGCTTSVTYRFIRAGVTICQDHALSVWAAVQEMNSDSSVHPERPKRAAVAPEGSVYYIRIGDRVKIGHSTDIFKRLASYPPTMEILCIRDGSRELEHQEHVRFGEHRTDGREWFHANECVLEMISKVAAMHPRDWEPEWFQRRTHKPQTISRRELQSERSSHGQP